MAHAARARAGRAGRGARRRGARARGRARRARRSAINARDLSTFRSTAARSSSSSPRAPRDRVRDRRERRSTSRAQGAAAELAGADAILVGSALMRAPDPAAKLRELLSRPLVKVCGLTRAGGRRRRGRGGRRPARLHPRRGEPAPRGRRARRPGDGALGRRLRRRGGDEPAPTSSSSTRGEGGHRGPRRRAAARRRARSRRVARPAVAGGRPVALGARPRAPRAASCSPAASAADNVREAIERVRPWAVDAASSLEREPGDQGPRRGARVRGGGPGMTASGLYGDVRRPLRPRDADPRARRARARAGRRRARRPASAPSCTTSARLRRPADAADARRAVRAGRSALYLKREDLLHTGAHKLNNALGQAVLARRLGKRRIVAETGAGQHGVATATVCARFGLECVVYMGAEDMRRQQPNVERMGLLGAEVRPGRVRDADAEGGDERGDPRLDHERRDDALPDRLLRRPGAVPRDRPRAAGA